MFYNDLGINAPPSSGFGFGLEASFWLGDKFSLGLDLSLIGFGEKNSTETVFVPVNVKSSAAAAPIMIAGKYFFSEGKLRPYIGLGVGVIIVSRKLVFSNAFLGTSETEWDQSGFVLAPKAGMQYELTNRMSLHANLQYNLAINEVSGSKELDVDGEKTTVWDAEFDPTTFLGINIGLVFTLAD